MQEYGALTIYTWVTLPNLKIKRVAIHRNYQCEGMDEAVDTLENVRKSNPHLQVHAEFIVRQHIS